MVKFGQRLVEELVNDGWEDNYLRYKPLKKIISAISKAEVSGEMVQAFEKQELFLAMIKEDVAKAATFYLEEAAPVIKAMKVAREAVSDLLLQKSKSSAKNVSDMETAINVDTETLEGVEVMDDLADAYARAEVVRQFWYVNREAVRKILKKYHKKTSAGTEEVHADLEGLLKDTPLDDGHEIPKVLSEGFNALRDAQAHLALKSRAHAAYIRSRNAAASPRPSKDASLHGSNSGRLSGRDAATIELVLDEANPADDELATSKECKLDCPCGVTWVSHLELAPWWHVPKQKYTMLALYAVGLVVAGCAIAVIVTQPTRLGRLSVLGTYASVLVAVANGANDIANSVGTSVGAKALTLRQAIFFGLTAEVLGAMTLGSLVAKTISKGVISPDTFDAEGCEGVLKFGVSMVCVLCGTGLTTLLATLYGLPISASHGVIGGLIAVGLVAQGPGSLGIASIAKTMIAWVASPLIGAVSAAVVYWIILYVVHRSSSPGYRAILLQPLFVAVTVAVAAGFIVIKGPDALKIKPVGAGVGASIGIGAGVGLLTFILRIARGSKLGQTMGRTMSRTRSAGGPHLTNDTGTTVVHDEAAAPSADDVKAKERAEAAEAAAKLEVAEKPFVPLLILSALTVAFAHGANDVGNAVGPLAAIMEASIEGRIVATPQIPIWVLAIGSGGFVFGIAALGSRTIATVGGKITTLTPSKSFSVQIGAAVAVLSSTVLGLAVSTSHCLVGSVVGVGIASRISKAGGSLNGKMLLKIFIGWGVTIPLAMLVAIIFYYMIMPGYGYSLEELLQLNATNATCY